MKIEQIAELAHEANRTYCQLIGDNSQVAWADAPDWHWQKQGTIKGVNYRLGHPMSSAESQHENWLKDKLAAGWKYGKVKDQDKKKHPCCVPYAELSLEQRIKDILFLSIVETMRPLIGR